MLLESYLRQLWVTVSGPCCAFVDLPRLSVGPTCGIEPPVIIESFVAEVEPRVRRQSRGGGIHCPRYATTSTLAGIL